MTDKTREKPGLRRIIGLAICPLKDEAPEFYKDCAQFNSACPDDCPDMAAKIDLILSIPNIARGLELVELEKAGKLAELDDDQSCKVHAVMRSGALPPNIKRVKPLASGESR
ncbi:hypothetical protein LCGC14_2395030 [marine sediment metagenome]|uniref:Uncharacterized protein n=1 Tax=marine sediment metagenome TaxID=412755 RepID=A0A0F9CJ33_9ZZZZ